MSTPFKTIGLLARRRGTDIIDSVVAVEESLRELGLTCCVEAETAALLPAAERRVISREALGQAVDLVVVVGGDGSLLGIGREMANTGVPVVGVNRGGLGFLAAIAPHEIHTKISDILGGHYEIEDHFLLAAGAVHDGELGPLRTALNDIVVSPGSRTRMMEFALWVDGEYVYDQRSDGLIVASPTGSTAYALSAGGPIMHPGLDAIVIVPMFPHTLTSRPLVVPGDATIKLELLNAQDAYPQASFDSQVHMRLEIGDSIQIQKHPAPLKLLYPSGHSFYESCRSKLDWASRLGGQKKLS